MSTEERPEETGCSVCIKAAIKRTGITPDEFVKRWSPASVICTCDPRGHDVTTAMGIKPLVTTSEAPDGVLPVTHHVVAQFNCIREMMWESTGKRPEVWFAHDDVVAALIAELGGHQTYGTALFGYKPGLRVYGAPVIPYSQELTDDEKRTGYTTWGVIGAKHLPELTIKSVFEVIERQRKAVKAGSPVDVAHEVRYFMMHLLLEGDSLAVRIRIAETEQMHMESKAAGLKDLLCETEAKVEELRAKILAMQREYHLEGKR